MWGDDFQFKIQNEKEMVIECYDKENIQNDKLIGSATVSIVQWFQTGFDGDVELTKVRDHVLFI